jgi:hypothetical protein
VGRRTHGTIISFRCTKLGAGKTGRRITQRSGHKPGAGLRYLAFAPEMAVAMPRAIRELPEMFF